MGSLFGAKSVHFYQAISVYFILAVTRMTIADILREEGLEKGLEQGLEQGLKQGMAKALVKMLTTKLKGMPNETIQYIYQLEEEKIEFMIEHLDDIKTMDDLNNYL